ncbi:MAG TPA: branched-chain amino acid aminotransferase [Streptosporangiaceae bacterium]|jgi:branched-chain amino acid aminotransferase
MTDIQAEAISFEVRASDSPVPAARREQIMSAPGFGSVFTDHMATIRWDKGEGWHDARIETYGPIALDPSCSIFHYGQEIFEGLKAYRRPDGRIATFRPQANASRFQRSAARLAMPPLPEQAFITAVELLVRQDQAWVPEAAGQSLYLRPFMIATQNGLGLHAPSTAYLFTVIASPAAGYFGGDRAVSVWLSEDYIRAAPGGTGEAKCGGNYAGAFAGQQQALDHGCDQVVWLDAAERRYVEEMGGMNLFFVSGSGSDARLLTPATSGALLHGITRDSLLKLGPDLGIPASEERISVDRWQAGCASGEITEVFACGTAAVITPVGSVRSSRGDWQIGDGNAGPVTTRLREELVGIQFGTGPDPYAWIHQIC